MTKDEFYMGKALEEAKMAYAVGEIPIGAVIIYQKKAIARAYNLRESLPCATAHAELLAIEKACRVLGRWRLSGCTLYVTCEPCPMCAGAILNARLSRVVYGAADPKAGCMGSVCDLTAMPFPTVPYYKSGVLEAECREVLDQFFRELRKKGE